MTRQLFLFAALLLLPISSAKATTVLIDWSDGASTSGADGNGNYWTTVGDGTSGSTSASATDLISSSNGSTPWDVSVTGLLTTGIRANFGGTGINGPTGPNPFDQSFAVIDGIYSQSDTAGATATITFTDLLASTLYDFSAIGGRDGGGVDGTIGVTIGSGSGGTLLNDGTVLDFTVTSDGSGTIALTFVSTVNFGGGGNGTATFNALSVTGPVPTAPEPTTAVLAGLGLLGSLLIRRRRRR